MRALLAAPDRLEDVSARPKASPPESRSACLEIGKGAFMARVGGRATLQTRCIRPELGLPNSVRRNGSPIAAVLLHRVGRVTAKAKADATLATEQAA